MAISYETDIAGHYTSENLLESIKSALVTAGKNPDKLAAEDLKGVDEFHTGGVQATDDLISQLTIPNTHEILDIGCGIGGAARHIATNTGAVVTGVDLTPDYVKTAEMLSNMVGMKDHTTFQIGSALDMPVADSTFDLATMFHVGMNISDKAALFREVARVLKPSGTFALFDIMSCCKKEWCASSCRYSLIDERYCDRKTSKLCG